MMLSPARRREALETRHPTWNPMTISQALDSAVAEYPDRPFVITDCHSFSYSEIQNWSRRLAAGLIHIGVKAGDHVAIIMANHPEFVAIKYAVSRVGAVAVPINFLLRQQELKYVLEQSDSTVLITMDRMRDRDYLADLDALIPGWEISGGGTALPKLRGVFVVSGDETPRPGTQDLDALGNLAPHEDHQELQHGETHGAREISSYVYYPS